MCHDSRKYFFNRILRFSSALTEKSVPASMKGLSLENTFSSVMNGKILEMKRSCTEKFMVLSIGKFLFVQKPITENEDFKILILPRRVSCHRNISK